MHNPAILRGLEVIKKGMIWRVGDGYNLNIWRDPWLPRGTLMRPITPRDACLLTQVAELMNLALGEWDVQLGEGNFLGRGWSGYFSAAIA